METKTCSITEDEIKELIRSHSRNLSAVIDEETIDRINYLNRRLKAEKKEVTSSTPESTEQKATPSW